MWLSQDNQLEHAASLADKTGSSPAGISNLGLGMSRKELRQQAEKSILKKISLAPETIEALSLRENQPISSELWIDQVEQLEIQNEELHRTLTKRETERTQYLNLYNLAPVGYCTLNMQGQVLGVNVAGAIMLGVNRDQLLNQLFSNFILTGDQEKHSFFHRQLLESSKPQRCELRLNSRANTTFWVHLHGTATPGPDGTFLLHLVLNDISERKEFEMALHKSNERLQVLVGTMLQGIIHQDASGKIIAMNPAAESILGKNSEQLLGICATMEAHQTIRENREPFPTLEHPSAVALRTGLPVKGVIMGIFNPKLNSLQTTVSSTISHSF